MITPSNYFTPPVADHQTLHAGRYLCGSCEGLSVHLISQNERPEPVKGLFDVRDYALITHNANDGTLICTPFFTGWSHNKAYEAHVDLVARLYTRFD